MADTERQQAAPLEPQARHVVYCGGLFFSFSHVSRILYFHNPFLQVR